MVWSRRKSGTYRDLVRNSRSRVVDLTFGEKNGRLKLLVPHSISMKRRFVASLTLLVWLGVAFHDVWLVMAETPHHHHQDNDHGGDADPCETETLPLEDTHAVPMLAGSTVSPVFVNVVSVDRHISNSVFSELPPPFATNQRAHGSQAPPRSNAPSVFSILLAHSVFANAPPYCI